MNFDKVNQLLINIKITTAVISFEKYLHIVKHFMDAVNAFREPLSKMAVITE